MMEKWRIGKEPSLSDENKIEIILHEYDTLRDEVVMFPQFCG
jgi:hypothetical protein